MQALRSCPKHIFKSTCAASTRRALLTTTPTCSEERTASNSVPSPLPWFVDPLDATSREGPSVFEHTKTLQQQQLAPLTPIPAEVDSQSPIRRLHTRLSTSPFLEPGALLVCRPIPTDVGPPLPLSAGRGRRQRGRTYCGEGMLNADSGIWQWNVIAQVKEGTENRGAIESVVRAVRQTLLKETPSITIPPRRKVLNDGWAMIDAGDFAIHIVSKTARERFFPERRVW